MLVMMNALSMPVSHYCQSPYVGCMLLNSLFCAVKQLLTHPPPCGCIGLFTVLCLVCFLLFMWRFLGKYHIQCPEMNGTISIFTCNFNKQ